MTHEARLALIHKPLPPVRVLPNSYRWAGAHVCDYFGEGQHNCLRKRLESGEDTTGYRTDYSDDPVTTFDARFFVADCVKWERVK